MKSFAFKEDKYTLTQTSVNKESGKMTLSPPLEGVIKVPDVADKAVENSTDGVAKSALERINNRYKSAAGARK